MAPKAPAPAAVPGTSAPGVPAPKFIRLMRDGLVWQFGKPWPSPQGHGHLAFNVTDIYWDDEEDYYVVLGMPMKAGTLLGNGERLEKETNESKLGLCIMARVPEELGSTIVEAFIPVQEAAQLAQRYVDEAVDAWAARWEGDEDDEDPDDSSSEKPENAPS